MIPPIPTYTKQPQNFEHELRLLRPNRYSVEAIKKNLIQAGWKTKNTTTMSLQHFSITKHEWIWEKTSTGLKKTYGREKIVKNEERYMEWLCKLSIASENNIDVDWSTFKTKKGDWFIRQKVRTQFTNSEFNWVFDISAVSHAKVDIDKINEKSIFDKIIFPKHSYEIEIEWLGTGVFNLNILHQTASLWYPVLVNQHIVQTLYQRVLKNVKRGFRFRQITNQPIGLEMQHMKYIKKGYAVTPKADGERVLLVVLPGVKAIFMIKNGFECSYFSDLKVEPNLYLLDGEYIDKKIVYVFDILVWNGKNVMNHNFKARQSYDPSILSNNVERKKHIWTNPIWKACKQWLTKKLPYNIDGLIFTPLNSKYKTRHIYKWKPVKDLTVDGIVIFEGKVKPGDLLPFIVTGSSGQAYQLFKIKYKESRPIQWNVDGFDMKIRYKDNIKSLTTVECEYDDNGIWNITRVRDDKTRILNQGLTKNVYEGGSANYIKIANRIWEQVKNPITKEMITTGKYNDNSYFVDTSSYHRPQVFKYHNLVKGSLMKKYIKPNAVVLELAGGRGGDIAKLIGRKVKSVTFIEIDKHALMEAKRRYSKLKTTIHFDFVQQDLTVDNPLPLPNSSSSYTVVQMHFALHYLFKNERMFGLFVDHVEAVTKLGSLWIITTLDGSKVSDMFNTDTKVIEFTPFKLERMYDEYSAFGSAIQFSSHTIKPKVEYLINPSVLSERLSKWELLESLTFDKVHVEKTPTFLQLSENEQKYSSMNRFYVFKRINI